MDDKAKPKTSALAQVETSVCGLVLNNLEDMTTVAQIILQSKIAPDSFKTKEQIFVGLQTGAEIGLKPMQALNSIVVIHGKPTLWGDAALALVKKSGLLGAFSEEVTGKGDDMIATVKSVRVDVNYEGTSSIECTVESTFSVADAKTANLWKKPGPWTTHPKRMLKYKARAFNLRDNFPDVLFGMHLTEEMYGEEPLPAPESDVAPRDERRMAVPSSTVDTTRAPVKEEVECSCGDNIMREGVHFPGCPNHKAPVKEVKEKVVQVLEEITDAVLGADTAPAAEEKPLDSEQVTFQCPKCLRTYQYGKEEGKGVQCECGKGVIEEQGKQEKPEPEPEKAELAAAPSTKELYVEVNGMYVAQDGKDFYGFAAYVLCIDESEVSPSKLTEEQLKRIKAYIETSGVTIN